MRGSWNIKGANNMRPEVFQVEFTKDSIGATLSICSHRDQKIYSINADFLLKELKKGGHL